MEITENCWISMAMSRRMRVTVSLAIVCICSCTSKPGGSTHAETTEDSKTVSKVGPSAPSPQTTGGFDGARAFEHVRRLVELGPRPPGSPAIQQAQSYIVTQLKRFGCQVDEDDFRASTPIGDLAMKNIVAKIPGAGPDLLLLATHYDTVRLPDFVGADDGGSGSGMMLELARLLCARKSKWNVWIAFFDGEEAQGQWADRESIRWTDTNSTFGSRELAARMALSGELQNVKAMVLADMIGPSNLRIKRDTYTRPLKKGELESTPWLIDVIWSTATRLGYGNVFVDENYAVGGDDHFSFIRRGVAACDLIDFDVQTTYWHTPQDTLDKVDPRSLAVVGHVLLSTLPALEQRPEKVSRHQGAE